MAKDPAMLWYWSDWNSGTQLLSRFLKGCYIDILHAQFNNGPLSLEEIKTCLGSDFGTSWPTLQKKFKTNDSGLFFNERLELEKEKRASYTESRRSNGAKKNKPPAYAEPSASHMVERMEDRNRNESTSPVLNNLAGKFCEDLSDMEIGTTVEFSSITLHRKFTSQRISDLWRAFIIQHGEKYQPSRSARVEHFRNWIKTQPHDAEEKKKQDQPTVQLRKI